MQQLVWVPLVVLGAAASWVTGLGLEALWITQTGDQPLRLVVMAIASALHLAWLLPACAGRRGLLVGAAWLICVGLCGDGLVAAGFDAGAGWNAFVLEGLTLALALRQAPRQAWPDRVAQWRRSRERIETELRLGRGLWPWACETGRRLWAGEADRPLCSSFNRIVAELNDSGERMRRSIAALALPTAVRDALTTAAHDIVTDAEVTMARMAIELERRALDQAAVCRDAVLSLSDLPEAERERLAAECESLMLELAHSVGVLASINRRREELVVR